MNDKPLVSIIMGAYNCEDSLTDCVKSIQNQTYDNWEFIICDDCSTDRTYKVVKSLAAQDSRIVVIQNKENSKLPATLNHCLKVAKGKYVARMDADDICLPDRLAQQVEYLESHSEVAVVGGAIIPFDDISEKRPRVPKEHPKAKDMVKDVPFYHPTIMMRKEVYDQLGGYTEAKRTIKGQDADLWFRFYANGYIGYNLQKPVLKYHESIDDYKKKRNYTAAWGMTQTRFIGFKLNKFPFYLYPLTLKPLVAVAIPRKLMHLLHNRKK